MPRVLFSGYERMCPCPLLMSSARDGLSRNRRSDHGYMSISISKYKRFRRFAGSLTRRIIQATRLAPLAKPQPPAAGGLSKRHHKTHTLVEYRTPLVSGDDARKTIVALIRQQSRPRLIRQRRCRFCPIRTVRNWNWNCCWKRGEVKTSTMWVTRVEF